MFIKTNSRQLHFGKSNNYAKLSLSYSCKIDSNNLAFDYITPYYYEMGDLINLRTTPNRMATKNNLALRHSRKICISKKLR